MPINKLLLEIQKNFRKIASDVFHSVRPGEQDQEPVSESYARIQPVKDPDMPSSPRIQAPTPEEDPNSYEEV